MRGGGNSSNTSVREMEATIQDTLLQLSQLAGGGRPPAAAAVLSRSPSLPVKQENRDT